eukprot:1291605-Karenia_brevis.AAC.1
MNSLCTWISSCKLGCPAAEDSLEQYSVCKTFFEYATSSPPSDRAYHLQPGVNLVFFACMTISTMRMRSTWPWESMGCSAL